MKKTLLALFMVGSFSTALIAQDEGQDLLSLLQEEPVTDYATATFKTNRIINGHSIENVGAGVLDFKINHRFGPIRNGVYDMFGLDGAAIRLGLDYGVTDRLMIGVGRNSIGKTIDGYAKYKILRQSTGKKKMPISLSYLIDAQIVTEKFANPDRDNYFSSRVSYTHQLLLARKMGNRLSLQLMPTLVHRNLTTTPDDKNDVIAIGAGGRIKLTRRLALNAEYYYVLPDQVITPYENSLSIGFDIETGGHVFQLHFSNSNQMSHRGFITETTEPWFWKSDDGGLATGMRFGFNISRVFTLKKPKGLE